MSQDHVAAEHESDAASVVDPLEGLSLMLWRERETMDELFYRFGVEELVLQAGRLNWLVNASRDIEVVLNRLREIEALRIVATQAAIEYLGLLDEASLSDIARACPEPWRSIFDEHRSYFLDYTHRIVNSAAANRELIASGQRAIRETLLGMGEERPDDYSSRGDRGRAAASVYLDQKM